MNLFRIIKYHREEFLNQFKMLLLSREMFNEFKEQINTAGLTDIQRAARYFYLIKLSFGAKKDSFNTSGKNFDRTLDRLEEIQDRLSTVSIENKDFEKLIKIYDREEALFYLDPPYHETENYYKSGNTFIEADHKRLLEYLRKLKGKFILSYMVIRKNFNTKKRI